MTKKTRIFLIIICVLLVAIAAELLMSNFWLKTTTYRLEVAQLENNVNIVYLSDLHNRTYGKENKTLIKKVAQAKPDLIAVVGDIMEIDSTQKELQELLQLLSSLAELAPTYVSYGNHDIAYEKAAGIDFKKTIDSTGAIFLEETYQDIMIGEAQLRIGGMYAYAFAHHQTKEEWQASSTYQFLSSFENTALPTVLLCHRPDSFFYYDAYLDWDIDVILCGHTHGGIVRIPFVGGVVAPDQLLFPEYDYGEYQLDDTLMIIGGGLSGYGIIPRVFNRPEIVKLKLTA